MAKDRRDATSEESITKQTHAYILKRPSLRECLGRGLLNHSALAREICDELGIDRFDGVLAATKRLGARLSKVRQDVNIDKLMRDIQVRVTNRLAIVVVEAPQNFEKLNALQRQVRKSRGRFNIIDGDEFVTLLFSQQHLDSVKATVGNSIKSAVTDLAQVNLIFDKRIETTPGVVSHVYGLLAFHGINVREEMSCWTDIILVVDERDLSRTLLALESVSA